MLGQSVARCGEPPTSAKQLRRELEAAIKSHDTNAVLALVNWKGVVPDMKTEAAEEMGELAGSATTGVKLLPLPADYHPTNELNGVRYFPNVNVVGLIDVESPQEGNSTQLPYGESGGAFYLASILQETFDPHAKKEVSLGISISGRFPKGNPGVFKCAYVYLAGGEEKDDDFECTNNISTGFWGDAIKSCTVVRASGLGSYQVKITADGQSVFDSGMVETNDSVIYEKPGN
jgi:hypothetical protein